MNDLPEVFGRRSEDKRNGAAWQSGIFLMGYIAQNHPMTMRGIDKYHQGDSEMPIQIDPARRTIGMKRALRTMMSVSLGILF
jgi:hypothetical protein